MYNRFHIFITIFCKKKQVMIIIMELFPSTRMIQVQVAYENLYKLKKLPEFFILSFTAYNGIFLSFAKSLY